CAPVGRVDDDRIRRVASGPQGVLGLVDRLDQIGAAFRGEGGEVARIGQTGQVRAGAITKQQLPLDALRQAIPQPGVDVRGNGRRVRQELARYLDPVRDSLDHHVVLRESDVGFRLLGGLRNFRGGVGEARLTQRVYSVAGHRNYRDALTDRKST